MELLVTDHLGKSKVRYLDRHFLLVHDQNVLWLQIAMHDTTIVKVLDSIQDLAENVPCLALRELLLIDDLIKQLAVGSTINKKRIKKECMLVARSCFCAQASGSKYTSANLQLSHDIVKLLFVENLTDPEEIGL